MAEAAAGAAAAEVAGPSGQASPGSSSVPGLASAAGASGSGGESAFECNICLEVASEPVVTLCGHLFCWACLYRWVEVDSRGPSGVSGCPVCKAAVEPSRVIPLYGRGHQGGSGTHPASSQGQKPAAGAGAGGGGEAGQGGAGGGAESIPTRPQGQRPPPPPPPPQHHHHHQPAFGVFAQPAGPFATAQFGSFTLSAGFGLFPSLFGLQFHAFPTPTHHHQQANVPNNSSHSSAAVPPAAEREMQQQQRLSQLLLMLGCLVIICLLWF
eukprot:jgi/Chlat1/3081/Chrsp21S00241